LERVALTHEGRPALISSQTVRLLEKYLAFRHVVWSIYGYESEVERIAQLVTQQETVWQRFEAEVRTFITWLRQTAKQLE
jgi:uncharacterized protein YegL